MKHNTRSFISENFIFGGKYFISWLGPASLANPTFGWYYCDDGELFLLKKSWDNQYVLAEETPHRPVLLKSIDEMKDYVHASVRRANQSKDIIESLLQTPDVVCIAIYPGFARELDDLGESDELLQFFYNSVESSHPDMAGRLLSRCISIISKVSPKTRSFVSHCLKHMSAQSVGLLSAYGLNSQYMWQTRHREALIEGWRFQLQNPTQLYLSPASRSDSGCSICLIERDISSDHKDALLAATGLTDNDVKQATDLANFAPDEEAKTRTTTLLRFLAQRSNLGLPKEASIDIESLGSLTE